jgi:hydroxyacylglutathione hydrolase
MKRSAIVLVLLLASLTGLAAATTPRRLAMLPLLLLAFDDAPVLTAEVEGPGARWYDDFYTITAVDETTYAIGEPLNPQQNYNYLILGDDRALLFDSGSGRHDIRPVVASLTDLPVLAVPSHLHYDHIGAHIFYPDLALIDLPCLRERAPDNKLALGFAEHLGFAEGIARPTLDVKRWLAPGSTVDLGGRRLQVLHTPGHTPDSMALYDLDRDQLFIGDFITEGPVFLFVPGSSVGDELATADALLERIGEGTTLLTAHRLDPPGLPTLARADLVALRDALVALREGRLARREDSPWWPRSYPANERVWLFTDFEWAQEWD